MQAPGDGRSCGSTGFVGMQNAVSIEEGRGVAFVGTALRRCSLSVSWGLSVALYEGKFLIVGRVDVETVERHTRWLVGNCSRRPPSPRELYLPTSFDEEQREGAFRTCFAGRSEERRLGQGGAGASHLQEGDGIISINGRTLCSFANLTDVTDYLRKRSHLLLVVLRPPSGSVCTSTAPSTKKTRMYYETLKVLVGDTASGSSSEERSGSHNAGSLRQLQGNIQRYIVLPEWLSPLHKTQVKHQLPPTGQPKLAAAMSILHPPLPSPTTPIPPKALSFHSPPVLPIFSPSFAVHPPPTRVSLTKPVPDTPSMIPASATRRQLLPQLENTRAHHANFEARHPSCPRLASSAARTLSGVATRAIVVSPRRQENPNRAQSIRDARRSRVPPVVSMPWFYTLCHWDGACVDTEAVTLTTGSLQEWLALRKDQWRKRRRWKKLQTRSPMDCVSSLSALRPVSSSSRIPQFAPVLADGSNVELFSDLRPCVNEMFQLPGGEEGSSVEKRLILFSDNYEVDPDDGCRISMFLSTEITDCFQGWLSKRKATWRKAWKVRPIVADDDDGFEDEERTVPVDFWSHRGYTSFDDWLADSTAKWKRGYSWQQKKRRKLEEEAEIQVRLPQPSADEKLFQSEFLLWLGVRRNQWRILRRKRQRQREASLLLPDNDTAGVGDHEDLAHGESIVNGGKAHDESASPPRRTCGQSPTRASLTRKRAAPSLLVHIDAMLDDEAKRQKSLDERPPLDISFIFDPVSGAPDDVVVHCVEFLPSCEHWKLVCISRSTKSCIEQRHHMWRALCHPNWTLPRRPRKSWYQLYLSRLRQEDEQGRKRADDLLTKAAGIVARGDQVQKMEKLVAQAQKSFAFSVNYVSSVVMERNSLLNLACIFRRVKIARWLIETKGADIESADRGDFTPLLNAAWAGDKCLVRLLLTKGANRNQVGKSHYSQPLTSNKKSEATTAEGWARRRGHHKVAELIKLGLS